MAEKPTLTPFDFVRSINDGEPLEVSQEEFKAAYKPWFVNHALSFFPDTVHIANWANLNSHLPPEQQYAFLLGIVPPRRRFRPGKWSRDKDPKLELVQKLYGFSTEKAKWALRLLTEDQLKELKKLTDTGGPSK